MLTVFNALKAEYASREIALEDLEALQEYEFIHFENKGISRSDTDCLLCEVHCAPFEEFLKKVSASVFDSPSALREFVETSGLGLNEFWCDDDALMLFGSEDETMEMTASVGSDGRVSVDPDDIDALPYFQVFLRVQGR